MRVPTTTATGPVADFTQEQIDTEFPHIIWTNFSGQVRIFGAFDLGGALITGAAGVASAGLAIGLGTLGLGFVAVGVGLAICAFLC